MNEYTGSSAKTFEQTDGKKYLVIPAVNRAVPKAQNSNQKLLDVACGNADFFTLANQKGYQYYGLDLSPDMIERAKVEYPRGSYLIAPSTQFATKIQNIFEVILISMLFPYFNNKNDIANTLVESKKVLTKDGRIIIVVSHPLYDCYMRKEFFGLDYVESNFKGYFESPMPMRIHKKFEKGTVTFNDYHWTLSDYISCINKANLQIESIDECPPTNAPSEFTKEKSKYPTYLLLNCK